jgi:predicted amidophosphoribosyltransferase
MMRLLQRALTLIYPDQCCLCTSLVDRNGGLCADCWRDMPFLSGVTCDMCGASLPGEGDDGKAFCDACLATPMPWQTGRAALSYRGSARRLVLGLKHGDRTDLVPAAARWMARAGRDVLAAQPVLVPVPVFWTRLVWRRYNQAAELAKQIGQDTGCPVLVEGLRRTRRTPMLDGMTPDQRFQMLGQVIAASPALVAAEVCLIDDVMTSGATLSSCAKACHVAGVKQISVLVLARVEKAP